MATALGQRTPPSKDEESGRLILYFVAGTILVAAILLGVLAIRAERSGEIIPPNAETQR